MSRQQTTDLLQGTLDLLILRTLDEGRRHGWSIARRIQEMSQEVLRVNQGSLYPALYRLEDRGFITPEWGISDEGRRAKFYRLTPSGRKQLVDETRQWRAFSSAVNLVLEGS